MIYNKFKNNLLRFLENSSEKELKIAVAISGGIDSMAMLHMLAKFASEFKDRIYILTVNHNLRKNGKQDAEFVLDYAKSQNLHCRVLEWEHDGVTSNIQSKAREARYSLLTNFCKANDIDILLTAHHADDQIENFFIKLSRGVSIHSLCNNSTSEYNGVKILRPFDGIFKKEIALYVQENNIDFVEDESNSDSKYLRNEMRKKLEVFFQDTEHLSEKLFKQRILLTIQNITRANLSLNHLVEKCIRESFSLQENQATLYIEKYQAFMEEEQMQSLVKVLQTISGNNSTIRLDSTKFLYNQIIGTNPFASTLHGCIIKTHKQKIIISREQSSK